MSKGTKTINAQLIKEVEVYLSFYSIAHDNVPVIAMNVVDRIKQYLP